MSRKGNGDECLIKEEVALMRMESKVSIRSVMVSDYLGELTLESGNYDLKLSAFDAIKGKELFWPRTIILEPSNK